MNQCEMMQCTNEANHDFSYCTRHGGIDRGTMIGISVTGGREYSTQDNCENVIDRGDWFEIIIDGRCAHRINTAHVISINYS